MVREFATLAKRKNAMDRDLHPAKSPLFIAAALRGFRLQDTPDGRAYRSDGPERVVADGVTFKDVANLCGATGGTTLREAAERDGLTWPTFPEAFLAVVHKI